MQEQGYERPVKYSDPCLCPYCGEQLSILWIMFNHGPKYNPFTLCERACPKCGATRFIGLINRQKRKAKIAKVRLIYDEVLVRANLKGLL